MERTLRQSGQLREKLEDKKCLLSFFRFGNERKHAIIKKRVIK